MNRNIYAVIILAGMLLCATNVHAQYATKVTITNLNSASITAKAENAASKLLTELNQACFQNRRPRLDSKDMTDQAAKSLLALWNTSSFRCIETELIEPGVTTHDGFQVRNIPIFITKASDRDNYEEIVINFTSAGIIDAVYMSVENHQYKQLLQGVNSVTDMQRRQIILDFVENFRTAYGRKDINFLTQVFSDDALIITGRVVRQQTRGDSPIGVLPQDKVVLVKQNKREYLARLQQVFRANSYIYLDFNEIKITQHPKINEIYGVELKQDWHSDRYSDVGYLFLMIDFKNELQPTIQVRTWTPDSMFGLNDFDNIVRPD
jgi:hypothetical protein